MSWLSPLYVFHLFALYGTTAHSLSQTNHLPKYSIAPFSLSRERHIQMSSDRPSRQMVCCSFPFWNVMTRRALRFPSKKMSLMLTTETTSSLLLDRLVIHPKALLSSMFLLLRNSFNYIKHLISPFQTTAAGTQLAGTTTTIE